jgi:hypothetical protein
LRFYLFFSAKKLAIFSKPHVFITASAQLAAFSAEKVIIFAYFSAKIF